MIINIDDVNISINHPTYFIADIAANHDNDIERAKDLISLAKESGASAAKFQHFTASKLVSDYGFKCLGNQISHQSKWKKSVYEVYRDASINNGWNEILYNHSKKEGIHFFSSPYDIETVDLLDPFVPAYKIGSGDITYYEILRHIAKKNKPVLLATGASCLQEVINAVEIIYEMNPKIVLMQCNTNYTGKYENFRFISLNVLKTYSVLFPDIILGLSDHTQGHTTVLGAVALGARVIEKHFTDDNNREGPDHLFSMNPDSWKEMVERTRELELSFGNTIKIVEFNESETVILQRRCLRASTDLKKGQILSFDDIESLRPAPLDSLPPFALDKIIGKKINTDLKIGQHLRWEMLYD